MVSNWELHGGISQRNPDAKIEISEIIISLEIYTESKMTGRLRP